MEDNLNSTYGNTNQNLEPYMVYGDRSTMERLPVMQKESVVRDLEYLQGMYPGHMKSLQEYVIRSCDRLDFKNSPMYDEFPDRLVVDRVCDFICQQIRQDGKLQMADTKETRYDAGAEAGEVEAYEMNRGNVSQTSCGCSPVGPPTWGPPVGPPCGRPPVGPPTWGPPAGPPCGRPPAEPPAWGPPPRPQPTPLPQNPSETWLNDVVKVLLLNEMHHRRCRGLGIGCHK